MIKVVPITDTGEVRLEEYARTLIAEEQTHQDEVDKMLRAPGQTNAYVAGEI